MSRTTLPVLLAGCLGTAACGHGRLVPSDAAALVRGTDDAAVAFADGLRCTAETDAWEGKPGDLPASVAPIKVRISNDSEKPVRVRYEDFALVGESGRTYRPLPLIPFEHDARVPISPIYASDRFFVAPRLHDVYPELPSWSNPLPRDEALYAREYAKWGDTHPDRHVLREGLPEGMLAGGGSVTGFLYFESPTGRERGATLAAEFDRGGDAKGLITKLEIPFRVE